MSELNMEILTINGGGPRDLEFPGRWGKECMISVCTHTNPGNTESPAQIYNDYAQSSRLDILVLAHSDLTILEENWKERVLQEFQDPQVVLVGLGGALGLGSPDLYKVPYKIQDLARRGYVSNQTDWQTHGGLETQARDVAVVEAFFMGLRREWFQAQGGFPLEHLTHHCLDLYLACLAKRDGKKVRMVGVECTHWGGGMSVTPAYKNARWLLGGSRESDHQIPHRWLYDEFADCLPLWVNS